MGSPISNLSRHKFSFPRQFFKGEGSKVAALDQSQILVFQRNVQYSSQWVDVAAAKMNHNSALFGHIFSTHTEQEVLESGGPG